MLPAKKQLTNLTDQLRRKVSAGMRQWGALTEISKETQISLAHLSEFKDGVKGLDLENLERLADYFKIDISLTWKQRKSAKTSDLLGHTSATTSPVTSLSGTGEHATAETHTRLQQLTAENERLRSMLLVAGDIASKAAQAVAEIVGGVDTSTSAATPARVPRTRAVRRKSHSTSARGA